MQSLNVELFLLSLFCSSCSSRFLVIIISIIIVSVIEELLNRSCFGLTPVLGSLSMYSPAQRRKSPQLKSTYVNITCRELPHRSRRFVCLQRSTHPCRIRDSPGHSAYVAIYGTVLAVGIPDFELNPLFPLIRASIPFGELAATPQLPMPVTIIVRVVWWN